MLFIAMKMRKELLQESARYRVYDQSLRDAAGSDLEKTFSGIETGAGIKVGFPQKPRQC